MGFVRALTDVDGTGAEVDHPPDRVRLVVDGCGRQIEMDAVLARLLPRDPQEDDAEPGAVRRHETDLIWGFDVHLPTQRIGPEVRQTERVVRIETECDEPRRRSALHHRPAESRL
jgi:hypothetical protein